MTKKTDARRPASIAHIPRAKPGQAVWNPEYAKHIPWYPKSQPAWDAWMERKRDTYQRLRQSGHMGQTGIPFAWRTRREELPAARELGRREARQIVGVMQRADMLPDDDQGRAALALEEIISIIRARHPKTAEPVENAQTRLAACRVLLAFTKAAPGRSREVVMENAEAVLEGLEKLAA